MQWKYNLTIKFVENDVNGSQIRNNLVVNPEELKRDESIIFTFKALKHEKNGNIYEPVAKYDSSINVEKITPKNDDGSYTFNVTKLPTDKNAVITIVYTVEKYNVTTNYYRFDPTKGEGEPKHNEVKMGSKEASSVMKFRWEEVTLDVPKTLVENVNGTNEEFKLRHIYKNDVLQSINFNKFNVENQINEVIDLVYQQKTFNVTYHLNGGKDCPTSGRIDYEAKYSTLCSPNREGYTFGGWSLTNGGEVLDKDEINKRVNEAAKILALEEL